MLDLKEEQKYEQLRELAQELHVPIPEAFWELEVTDKKGKVIQKHKQRSHSWVRNAYNQVPCQLASKDGADAVFGAGNINIKDDTGAVIYGAKPIAQDYNASLDALGNGYRGNAGDDARGILVGSGTNAESFEDYILQTKIANGTLAGQLSYVAGEVPTKSYAALTITIGHIRYFNNNSGGSVSVNEVGIASYGKANALTTTWLRCRDKLASTVTVPNTGQLKVSYTIQLTYPA